VYGVPVSWSGIVLVLLLLELLDLLVLVLDDDDVEVDDEVPEVAADLISACSVLGWIVEGSSRSSICVSAPTESSDRAFTPDVRLMVPPGTRSNLPSNTD
jgi:hypothetical protein